MRVLAVRSAVMCPTRQHVWCDSATTPPTDGATSNQLPLSLPHCLSLTITHRRGGDVRVGRGQKASRR